MPTFLDTIIDWIQDAGAVRESQSDRDGFLSYKSESHATGMGIAAGWFMATTGDTQLLSIVYAAAVYGHTQGETGQRLHVLKDIKREPHYALGGAVTGAILGTLTTPFT